LSADRRRSRVELVARPLWSLRLRNELPRYLLSAAAIAGLGASARFAIAPPRAAAPAPARPRAEADPAAAGYAVLFARRFLSWQPGEPQRTAEALGAFPAAGAEPSAAVTPPAQAGQRVLWAEAVQVREPSPGVRVYTIAAETDRSQLVYVAVPVERTAAGLRVGGYPAFVGPPAQAPSAPGQHTPDVLDQALVAVVTRALHNFLAGAGDELAADLAAGARVSLPVVPLVLLSVQHVGWTPDGGSVVAVVQAQDARGARYTLEYELDVVMAQGRWEVGAVETDPLA
jgi:hypothetical protein